MKRFTWALGIFLLSQATAAPSASACSCLEVPVEQARAESAAVFEAQVASIEQIEGSGGLGSLRVRLDVVQTWKGANTEHVEVTTSANDASCGYPFEVGHSYLVYASEAGGELRVSLCSRTRRMEDADSDRAALGTGTIPVDVTDGPEDDDARPAQELAPRGGGCAGCSVGGGSGASAAMMILVILGMGIFRRRDR